MTRFIIALLIAVLSPIIVAIYLGIGFLYWGVISIFMVYMYSALIDLHHINRKKYLKI